MAAVTQEEEAAAVMVVVAVETEAGRLGPDVEVLRSNGRYCGYPECCIEDCIARTGRATTDQRRASQGTGFMPCPACAQLVLAGKPLHELLLPSRRNPRPFRYPLRRRQPV